MKDHTGDWPEISSWVWIVASDEFAEGDLWVFEDKQTALDFVEYRATGTITSQPVMNRLFMSGVLDRDKLSSR